MTPREIIRECEKVGAIVPGCPGCRDFYTGVLAGYAFSMIFAPRHVPSLRCESGRRPHCTCDTCF